MYHQTRGANVPVYFDTVMGPTSSNQVMDVNIPGGQDTAFYLNGSVDVDSMGKIVRKNNQAFLWDPDDFQEPLLFNPSEVRPLLDELKARARDHRTCDVEVEGNVPVICYARTHDEEAEADREDMDLTASSDHNQYDDVYHEDLITFGGYLHAAPAVTREHHLTHVPANPDQCEFCKIAKKKR